MESRWTMTLGLIAAVWTGAAAATAPEPSVPASALTGIELAVEVDPHDPSILTCQAEWVLPGRSGRLRIDGPPGLAALTAAVPVGEGVWSWTRDGIGASTSTEALLDLTTVRRPASVVITAERDLDGMTFQNLIRIDVGREEVRVSPVAAYRIRDESVDATRGVIRVDSLQPKAIAASEFAEDSTDRPIPEPSDCSQGSTDWGVVTTLGINSAPPGATATAITVHVTITHPYMADLQILFAPGFNTIGGYLWRGDSGTNLDRDFTQDRYGQPLPGLGQEVNRTWVLGVRDCAVTDTGTLEYWSVTVEYDAGGGDVDLVADTVAVDPATVEPGSTVEIQWSGHVAGSGSVADPFDVAFYLSSDTNITTADVLLGQVTESGASDPGDTFGESGPGRTLTIPGGTADGTYYLGMIVDVTDTVAESNEANNVAWASLEVATTPDDVDLVADSVSAAASSVERGQTLDISYSGHLSGSGTVDGSFSIGLYLSTDATFGGGDRLLAERTGSWASDPGDTFGETGFTVTVPAATVAGTYYLGMVVDSADVVAESNESNNTASHYPLEVTEPGTTRPNLVAMPCSTAPVMVTPPASVQLTWRGLNLGEAAAGAFTTAVYLSDDATIGDAGDSLVEQRRPSGWPVGFDTGPQQVGIDIDAGASPGTVYVGVVLDRDGEIDESDEGDNVCVTQLVVGEAGGPVPVTRWLVAAGASAPGVGSSLWRSQIAIANPTDAMRRASLYFVAAGSPWPGVLLRGPIQIAPRASAYFDDVLATLSPTTGLLYVTLDAPGPVVTSRTYNLAGGGATFGQGIPGVALDGAAVPTELVLPMIHSIPDTFRTNLGLVQTGAGSFQVEVSVYNSVGSQLGSKIYGSSAAWRQVNDLLGDMGLSGFSVEGGWVRVRLVSGSPEFWSCYASVVDSLTDDPTFIAPVARVPTSGEAGTRGGNG